MGRVDELRAALETSRAALRRALEGAGAKWEQQPGGEQWSPRRVAEHAIGAEARYANMAAAALQSQPRPESRPAFASNAEAVAALDAVVEASNAVYRRIEDRDLERAVDMGARPFPPTLAGVLQLAAWHAGDHAQQIGAASK